MCVANYTHISYVGRQHMSIQYLMFKFVRVFRALRTQYVGRAVHWCLNRIPLHLLCIVSASYFVTTKLVSIHQQDESARALDALHVDG